MDGTIATASCDHPGQCCGPDPGVQDWVLLMLTLLFTRGLLTVSFIYLFIYLSAGSGLILLIKQGPFLCPVRAIHILGMNSKLLLLYQLAEALPDCSAAW